MLLNYLISLLLITLKLSNAKYHYDNTISISSILGTQLIFNVEISDELRVDEILQTIIWYKGRTDLKLLINSTDSHQSRYHLVNHTNLLIDQTLIGDEGFYTLKIKIKPNIYKQYLYHVGSISLKNICIFLINVIFRSFYLHEISLYTYLHHYLNKIFIMLNNRLILLVQYLYFLTVSILKNHVLYFYLLGI